MTASPHGAMMRESRAMSPSPTSTRPTEIATAELSTPEALPPVAPKDTVAAEPSLRPPHRIAKDMTESRGYMRKADWLRAQFLPELELLDFRGLFVGNKGLGILEETPQREAAAVDPAQIADLLLRGNGYRRSGNHVKALMCYQELVDLDPHNPDFQFLLEATYRAVASAGRRP